MPIIGRIGGNHVQAVVRADHALLQHRQPLGHHHVLDSELWIEQRGGRMVATYSAAVIRRADGATTRHDFGSRPTPLPGPMPWPPAADGQQQLVEVLAEQVASQVLQLPRSDALEELLTPRRTVTWVR